jgi:hypothetical protein
MRRALLAAVVLALTGSPAAARVFRPPTKPFPTSILAGPPITPDGLMVRDGERLRTLELDELAPLRLRWTVRF